MTLEEARRVVVDGINYAAYKETDSSLHDSDKNRLFGSDHYRSGRDVVKPSPWAEGDFEEKMAMLLRWAKALNRSDPAFAEAQTLLEAEDSLVGRVIRRTKDPCGSMSVTPVMSSYAIVFSTDVASRKNVRLFRAKLKMDRVMLTVRGKRETTILNSVRRDTLRFTVVTLLACLAASNSAVGQWIGKQTGCYADSIAANPNRPTVANPADITQYGVLELEFGWDRLWPDEVVQQKSVGGLLKFGMLCDVELRWNTTSFLSQTDANGTHRSFGDNWLGPQVRVYRQTKRVPTMAFSYATKIPSASAEDGLGTGRVDHAFTFLASKDIAKLHFDFNITQFLIGPPNASGFDKNQQLNLAFSRVIRNRLQFTGELYGETRLNQTTPGFASSLWALTYTVVPRLVIDGGFEAGLTSGGPHRHAFVGATYSIANLYPGWRRRQPRSPGD